MWFSAKPCVCGGGQKMSLVSAMNATCGFQLKNNDLSLSLY